jgi:L-ribulose-5-phosphate 3-epimerase UlaE
MKDVERLINSIIANIEGDMDIDILRAYIDDMDRRLSRIDWVKNFAIIEMTLEPITGLDISGFEESAEEIIRDTHLDPTSKVREILNLAVKLYDDVANRLEYISLEGKQVFQRFRNDVSRILDEL